MALPLSNHHDRSRQLHTPSLNLSPAQWASLQTRRRQVNQRTQTYKARKGGSSHSIIRLMSSLDIVTYFVARCECVCRVWEAAPTPPFGFSPGSSFTCFLFLYRHFVLLSYPGTPHNFLGFLSLVLRTNVICISSSSFSKKPQTQTNRSFFLHLHSPAKPPLTNLDLPNLNSLTSTPAGNEVKHHQPD